MVEDPHSTNLAFEEKRTVMVEEQLRSRGIKDERVLRAMETVPRHWFVSPELASAAYEDHPLPIGEDQTISQPYIVAYMAEAAQIQPTDKLLEIGTGCGYSAAVLSLLAETVYTAEIIPQLGNSAKDRLQELGYQNIEVIVEDGSVGFAEHAPYDIIIVTAGAPRVPQELLSQLKVGGRMVVPVCTASGFFAFLLGEKLLRFTRTGEADVPESFNVEYLEDVGFVPLTGKAGWPQEEF
eukprot:gene11848-13745_t